MNSLWQTTHPLVTLTFESEIFSDEIRSAPQKTKNQFNLDGFIHNIHNHRRVFTRSESMHDLFNFMTFLMFPMTKLKIFELHCQESIQFSKDLEKSRGGRGRTRLQDLLTLFDEGGSILLSTNTIVTSTSEPFLVFGHGILEQYCISPIEITSYCLDLTKLTQETQNMSTMNALDSFIADTLNRAYQESFLGYFAGKEVPKRLWSC